ncbi:MAG: endonuclease III [Flavobacteriales bacterium]|nr:endonuclease III [Flavobacteriales bacterium]
MNKKERFKLFVDYFDEYMPIAETELLYSNGFELLVAVILSAQCTDKRVNQVTPALFQAFPVPEAMALSSKDEIFHYIRSVSYPNNKSKHLVGMANMLVNDFNSKVPMTVDELQLLPGVGRKTANVVASVLYDVPTMPVDTHVFRVSERVGLTTRAKNPLESEKQLVKGFPKDKLNIAHHWLILHGRYVCLARRPKCNECGISSFCSYFKKNS